MKRTLKVGEKVYGACTSFNSGETWIEEHVVKEISEDTIVTTHVADIRKRDGEAVREPCLTPKDHSGGLDRIDYFSMPFEEMMKKHIDDNKWLADELLKDESDSQ
jgi:hypothetical protein